MESGEGYHSSTHLIFREKSWWWESLFLYRISFSCSSISCFLTKAKSYVVFFIEWTFTMETASPPSSSPNPAFKPNTTTRWYCRKKHVYVYMKTNIFRVISEEIYVWTYSGVWCQSRIHYYLCFVLISMRQNISNLGVRENTNLILHNQWNWFSYSAVFTCELWEAEAGEIERNVTK